MPLKILLLGSEVKTRSFLGSPIASAKRLAFSVCRSGPADAASASFDSARHL